MRPANPPVVVTLRAFSTIRKFDSKVKGSTWTDDERIAGIFQVSLALMAKSSFVFEITFFSGLPTKYRVNHY